MDYLIIINDAGERVTTLLNGIHAKGMDELKKIAQADYPNHQYIEDNGTLQAKLISGDKIYKDGQVIERPPKEVTTEELRAQAEVKFKAHASDYEKSLITAQLNGDAELVASVQEEYKEYQAYYLELVENGRFEEFLKGEEE